MFDVIGDVDLEEGEPIFNLLQWDTETAGVAVRMRYAGRATGYIADSVFQGVFSAQYYSDFPGLPDLQVDLDTAGTFRVEIEDR